ncbi:MULTISPECIES: hypothetical protein [unclassified Streptomyces]|uniref:hypothetical protein n=1 Tax=unclassified Streptomyces TaxID=2593676 RepID=UPI00380FA3C1
MPSHQVTRSCGHEETVQLYGNRRDRDRRAEWEGNLLCHACGEAERDRQRQEERRAAMEAAERQGLPELEGSPKQIEWAVTLRHDLLSELEEFADRLQMRERRARERGKGAPDGDERVAAAGERARAGRTALAAVREVSAAKWFIDHRNVTSRALVERAARGEFVPRTPEQQAAGFDPRGFNTFTVPLDEVVFDRDGDALVTLRGSRWEDCAFTHPAALVTVRGAGGDQGGGTATGEGTQETVEVRFRGDWGFVVSDGRRKRHVAAQEMHADRTTGRREMPGPRHYLTPAPWRAGSWNEIDIPEGDVEDEAFGVFGDRLPGRARVTLRRSRWEGLYLHHGHRQMTRHRPGYVTLLIPPDMESLRLRGGAERVTVAARELAEDRARPLEEPGKSLAAVQERWHRVVFAPSRIRQVKDGASMCRFGWETQDPEAVVFHRGTMCRTRRDGSVAWHFPDRWTFTLRLPGGGTRTLSATEFVEVTASWARTLPAPGSYRLVPEQLDPVAAELDDALLDDLDLPDEWDIGEEPSGTGAAGAAADDGAGEAGTDSGSTTTTSGGAVQDADEREGSVRC